MREPCFGRARPTTVGSSLLRELPYLSCNVGPPFVGTPELGSLWHLGHTRTQSLGPSETIPRTGR